MTEETLSNDTESEVDQDAMMAEWEAMAEQDNEALDAATQGALGSTRVLDQEEIDSLLGVDSDDLEAGDKPGIQAILNSALVSYERLPMLEVVFDRLVRLMSTSLRNFTSDNVEVSLDNIASLRFGDYLNSIPLPAMLSVFKAEEWDNYGLVTVDSSLIYSIVDVLLGGRRGTAAMRIEGRPYTTIERSLVERMIHVMLSDLSAAFEPLSPVTFIVFLLKAEVTASASLPSPSPPWTSTPRIVIHVMGSDINPAMMATARAVFFCCCVMISIAQRVGTAVTARAGGLRLEQR